MRITHKLLLTSSFLFLIICFSLFYEAKGPTCVNAQTQQCLPVYQTGMPCGIYVGNPTTPISIPCRFDGANFQPCEEDGAGDPNPGNGVMDYTTGQGPDCRCPQGFKIVGGNRFEIQGDPLYFCVKL